ncbi:Mycolic acid cyclopropane synthetase-domain-containing protein [Dichomitus squalens]|uniref:Mycolic acid cyclopropane synthetase-domain-containing protein n=1 Tax=Dichomitus squalens TaxID=114155 RepID=A0A4Q9NCK4_9APHY|nr:Mycolic acid cyclopropane synthetase-domain-containing protein [Dichomitus squalens]TBU58567.1 Mycolic acid cyclopropane synthetase-domain-containing protein [Dichomitus squalens]
MSLYATQVLHTRTPYGRSIGQTLDSLWTYVGERLATLSLPFGETQLKTSILRSLSSISQGRLTIKTPDGDYVFGAAPVHGSSTSPLDITLKVRDDAFWRRLLLFSDLGLAEAFMLGEVECDDMSGLLQIVISNRQELDVNLNRLSTSLLAFGRRLTAYRFLGDIYTSPANISAHYDLGNALFKSFLSEDMNYSSAIFLDYREDLVKPLQLCESLESAQARKMQNLIKRAGIAPGDRVLEIGTGWGSLAILMASTVECSVDTITLSVEQHDLAVERIEKAGLSDRVTVHYMDFRMCRERTEWAGVFDKFISVEMIENVGRDFIEEYWRVVDWALKPKTSVGVVQVITMPEARTPAYDSSGVDFIQKWVFPGCYIPSLCFLVETLNRGSQGRLTVDSVSNIGPHYARTLREWKRKFLVNWDKSISMALVNLYGLDEASLGVFKRKWIYYFDYCEAGFVTRTLGDHIITFTREGNVSFGCDFKAD